MKESTQKSARIRSRSRLVHRGSFAVAVGALTVVLLAQPVAAQDRLITLRLNASTAWDTNVFRIPDSAPDPQLAQGISGKSDRITTTVLGLSIDKAYAQQRFQLDVSQTASRYAKFTSLNTDAFQYHGAWLWSLSPRVTGTLSADRAESLIPFSELTSPQRNVLITNTRTLNLDGWMFSGWHVLAGAVNTTQQTSQVFLAQPNYNTNSAELGLKYAAASGSSVTATSRSTRGNNPNQGLDLVNLIDNGYTQKESELKTTWMISGKSTLNGRLARDNYHYANIQQRDFSGTNGELSYVWDADGRLQCNFSVGRNVMPWTADTQASYRVDDKYSFAPSLQIGNTVVLRMVAYRLVSDFRGPAAPLTGPSRHDTERSAQLAVDWSPPMRHLRLTGSVQRDQRRTNAAGFEFDDTTAMLSASLTF